MAVMFVSELVLKDIFLLTLSKSITFCILASGLLGYIA